jgi:hypothetical protein
MSVSLTGHLRAPRRQNLSGWARRSFRPRHWLPTRGALFHPGPPAFHRYGAFLVACPRNIAEVATGTLTQFFVGRQPYDWVGIRETSDQRSHDPGIGLVIRPPNRPGSRQGSGSPELANVARAMSAPTDGGRRGHERHSHDRSADAHDPFPGLPRRRQTTWRTTRADVLSSKLAANSSERRQKRQCQS